MEHPDRLIDVVGDGQVAARAAGGEHLRLGRPDVVRFPFRDLPGGFGVLHLE